MRSKIDYETFGRDFPNALEFSKQLEEYKKHPLMLETYYKIDSAIIKELGEVGYDLKLKSSIVSRAFDLAVEELNNTYAAKEKQDIDYAYGLNIVKTLQKIK